MIYHKLFLPYIKDWSASDPIFDLVLIKNRICTALNDPINKNAPTPIPNNVISDLMCINFTESFDHSTKRYIIDIDYIIYKVFNSIRNALIDHLNNYMQTKRPQASQTYKWLNNLRLNDSSIEVINGIMLLYTYSMTSSCTTEHQNNVILILEVMRNKYGKI